MKPSTISVSVKLFFSVRWRCAMAGSSAEASEGSARSSASAARSIASIGRRWDRRFTLIAVTLPETAGGRKLCAARPDQFPCGALVVFHHDGGADRNAAIEVGDVFV